MYFRMFLTTSFILLFGGTINLFAQETPSPSPSPSPKRTQITRNEKRKKISGVKVFETQKPTADETRNNPIQEPIPVVENKPIVSEPVPPQIDPEAEREQREQRIRAGEAALERERQKTVQETESKLKLEFEKREAELKSQMEAERLKKEQELARIKEESEIEKKRIADEVEAKRLEAEIQRKRELDEAEAKRVKESEEFEARRKAEAELAEISRKEQEAVRLKKEQELAEAQKKLEAEEKAKIEAEQQVEIARRQAEELELKRLETERLAKESAEKEKAEKLVLRNQLIESTAKKLKFLTPLDSLPLVPATAFSADEIEASLKKAVADNPRLVKTVSFCDADFQGDKFTMDLTGSITMRSFLERLRYYYNVNFLPDAEILELPVQINVADVPWQLVLRSQLNFLDLEARCSDGNTVAILKRTKLQTMQENQRKTAPTRTEFIKLKYLQPVVGGQVNVAGRGSGGSNTLESLESAVNKILKADGDNRGSISRIPGKNEFIITATDDQLFQIKQVIERADRPSYQVIIYASIVTANENKLRDVGGQVSAVGGSANLNLLGGLTGFGGTSTQNNGGGSGGGNSPTEGGNSTTGGSTTGGASVPGSLVPGGVRTLGQGFGSAPSGGSTFGISNIFGTVQLSAQLNLLQQQGVVKIDNRPSIIVIDGQTADLQIGRQVAIPIQNTSITGGGNNELQILNAGNTLNASPQVIEDGQGNPVAVNLNLRVESNDVDTTVVSQGVPSIIRRSTQTSLMLNTSQTAVIGGFSTDSETNSESKTPGLGDVPLLGGLFKRKVKSKNSDRLYFAIRVEVVSQGQVLTTIPMNIDTSPRLPNPNNDFFKPYNQPVTKPEN